MLINAAETAFLPGITELHPSTRRLLLARALRRVGQGALVVDFTLYLKALGWSSAAIGLVLTVTGLFGAALSLAVGLTSDRLRRKPFLLGYEALALLSAVAAIMTAQPLILAAAAVAGAFGRGANGAAGPFSPAEQDWLAEEVEPARRGLVYSLNTAMGFFGMGLGALIAIAPALWQGWLGGPLAYRPLFALVGLASAGNLFLLAGTEEHYRGAQQAPSGQTPSAETAILRRENRVLSMMITFWVLAGPVGAPGQSGCVTQ